MMKPRARGESRDGGGTRSDATASDRGGTRDDSGNTSGAAARWRRFLRSGPAEVAEDVDQELSFHREMGERDFLDAGLPPEQARAAAAARLGNLDDVRRWLIRHDRSRRRRLTMGESFMELFGDVRYGVRKLVQQPAFALAMISVLALGTGATTAIFSAVDAVLLRPLPFADADRLVLLELGVPFDPGPERRRPKGGPDITDARKLQDVFTGVATYAPGGLNLSDEVNPRRVRVGVVTPNLFDLLGVGPMLGRAFTPAEEAPGAAPVVLLSERLWRTDVKPSQAAEDWTLTSRPSWVSRRMRWRASF
jgi:putative ABC transport system permease protein